MTNVALMYSNLMAFVVVVSDSSCTCNKQYKTIVKEITSKLYTHIVHEIIKGDNW